MAKTLVIGVSSNPAQYSHMAVERLLRAGHTVEGIGRESFPLQSLNIQKDKKEFTDIHTVTLYLNENRQHEYEEYILSLNPKRIIFNPGAENPAFMGKAQSLGIDAIEACTLVMLSAGTY